MPRRSQSSSRRKSGLSFEKLEPRQMLAGDVAAYVHQGTLLVIGDSASNVIEVVGNANGATIQGTDTTINGGGNVFSIEGAFQDVFIQMNEGDDTAIVQSLSASKQLMLQGNAGDDELRVMDAAARKLVIWLGNGNDLVEFRNVKTSRDIRITMGGGDDIVSVEDVVAGRDLKVWGNDGDDLFAAADLHTKRKFQIDMGIGDDQCILAGSVDVGKTTKVYLRGGDDVFAAVPAESNADAGFRRRLKLDAGAGNDQVVFDANVTLQKRSMLSGGAGDDAFQQGDATLHNRSKIRDFELSSVVDLSETIESVVERLLMKDLDPFDRAEPVALQMDAETQLVHDQRSIANRFRFMGSSGSASSCRYVPRAYDCFPRIRDGSHRHVRCLVGVRYAGSLNRDGRRATTAGA